MQGSAFDPVHPYPPHRNLPQRLLVTPTRSQYRAIGQVLQRGEIGRQVFLPKATSSVLYRDQYRRGSFSRRANSVSSGVFVRT